MEMGRLSSSLRAAVGEPAGGRCPQQQQQPANQPTSAGNAIAVGRSRCTPARPNPLHTPVHSSPIPSTRSTQPTDASPRQTRSSPPPPARQSLSTTPTPLLRRPLRLRLRCSRCRRVPARPLPRPPRPAAWAARLWSCARPVVSRLRCSIPAHRIDDARVPRQPQRTRDRTPKHPAGTRSALCSHALADPPSWVRCNEPTPTQPRRPSPLDIMSSPVPAVASPEHRRSQSHTHPHSTDHDDAHTTDHNTDHDDLDTDNDNDHDHDDTDMAADHNQDKPPANGQKPQANAKDPLRPRRKKARRACFACQRAHLTCGTSPTPPSPTNTDTPRRRETLQSLYQAQPPGPLHGWRPQKGKIPT
jgi:hypothetical protein